MYYAKNPILPGFCPDPSICRVGKDYYLVTSSFAYFPGVPIWHSRDLAHWEQIGNVLDRGSQLPLAECGHSQGIFAPTLRYHDGVFYMITTNISAGGNFVVTAENPAGPWSEPYYLGEAAQGIDPSLFFDEDGTCYYVGTRPNQKGVRYNGDWEIWVQELDVSKMELVGESKKVWKGAGHHVIWPEGPHLYKKDGYYYLMHAEGGTAENHAIAVARSENIWGPYVGCPNNPIFTHRHMGANYPIVAAGHGDLVSDEDGNWYVVMLASRKCDGFVNTGRDTYLAKVTWEEDWPVINIGVGKLEEFVELPGEAEYIVPEENSWHFYRDELPNCFMTLREREGTYRLLSKEGKLQLPLKADRLNGRGIPSYVAVRQKSHNWTASTLLEFEPKGANDEAGIAILCDESNHIRMGVKRVADKGQVALVACENGVNREIATCAASQGNVQLKIVYHGLESDWYIAAGDGNWNPVAKGVDVRMLSTECTGGFTGCTVGMYATANGTESDSYANFIYFAREDM